MKICSREPLPPSLGEYFILPNSPALNGLHLEVTVCTPPIKNLIPIFNLVSFQYQIRNLTNSFVCFSRCFGFVARKPASKTDNQCHIFAELEPEQPATAIVNFVSKVMMNSSQGKSNIV